MKRMKVIFGNRVIGILLIFTMLIGLMTACGEKEAEDKLATELSETIENDTNTDAGGSEEENLSESTFDETDYGDDETENNINDADTIDSEASMEEESERVPLSEGTEDSDVQNDVIDQMEVHFINVGQADSTLIICGEHAMLIDCADDSKGTTIQNYLKKQGVTKLDYLVLTHPDSDHIGGAPVIITKFSIDTVLMSNFEKDNKTYRKLIQALDDKSYTYATPEVGSSYTLGTATITFLAPNKKYSDPNNASIAFTISNGENTFLFTGDAEEDAEADILGNKYSIDADVLQSGHHGSSSASIQEFMDAVTPEYVVISCGEGNSYGYPHSEVLNRYRAMGIRVFRTDEQGTIVAVADGTNITWNCSPSETWKSGEKTDSSVSEQTNAASPQTTTAETPQNTETTSNSSTENTYQMGVYYIVNANNGKIHISTCSYLPKPENQIVFQTLEEVYAAGYTDFCKRCMK